MRGSNMLRFIALALLAIPGFGAKLGYINYIETLYENGNSLSWQSSPLIATGYRHRGTWTTPLGKQVFDIAIDGGGVLFTPDMIVITGSLTGDPVYFTILWSNPKTEYWGADGWPIPAYAGAWPDYVQGREPISFVIKEYWVYRQWRLVYWGPDQSRAGNLDTFEEKFYFLTPEPGTIGLLVMGGGLIWLARRKTKEGAS